MAITGLKVSKWTLGAVLAIACLFVSDNASVTQGASLITQANARIGRPLTPFSVAGVARRTTRRAYYYGGAAAGAYYYGSSYPYQSRGYTYQSSGYPYQYGAYPYQYGGYNRYGRYGYPYRY